MEKIQGWLNELSPLHHWMRFCVLVLALFFARGVTLLSIFPPLEGWDEYQHVAFLQHLHEHGDVPELGKASVSRMLLESCTAIPQPNSMLDQTSQTGSVGYQEFWDSGPSGYTPDHRDVGIYQAQHGSLYYRLVYPLFVATGGVNNLAQSIALLRLVNLLFGTIALAAVFWLLGRLVADRVTASLLVVVISLHPLYLLNVCRVANDSLAVCLGMLVIVWALIPNTKHRVFGAIVAGTILGCAAWAKGTNLALIPFVAVAFFISAVARCMTWRQAIVQCCTAIAIASVFVVPQFLHSFEQYGVLTPMQEAVRNHEEGRGLLEVVGLGLQLNIFYRLIGLWLGHAIFTGGWSFLMFPPIYAIVFSVVCLIALGGWGRLAIPQSNSRDCGIEVSSAVQMWSLIGCVSLALMWHMFQSNAAWGIPTTNSWYACVAAPFLMTLVLLGGFQFARRIGLSLGIALTLFFWTCGVVGVVCYMVPLYSQASGWLALSRLAQLQPNWLGMPTVLLVATMSLFLSALVCWSWLNLLLDTDNQLNVKDSNFRLRKTLQQAGAQI